MQCKNLSNVKWQLPVSQVCCKEEHKDEVLQVCSEGRLLLIIQKDSFPIEKAEENGKEIQLFTFWIQIIVIQSLL